MSPEKFMAAVLEATSQGYSTKAYTSMLQFVDSTNSVRAEVDIKEGAVTYSTNGDTDCALQNYKLAIAIALHLGFFVQEL